jgi:uncharacterized protein (TIGR03083 family)
MASNSLIERIDAAWDQLSDLVAGVGPLDFRLGASEWSVKDHLVHIAAWEQSTLALIEGRDRQAAMGVPDAKPEIETINDAVFRLRQSDSPDQVLADFRRSHEQLMTALEKLSDADLQQPYSHYQPGDPDEKRPVIEWVAGNTYEHYEEHAGWIKELVAQRG